VWEHKRTSSLEQNVIVPLLPFTELKLSLFTFTSDWPSPILRKMSGFEVNCCFVQLGGTTLYRQPKTMAFNTFTGILHIWRHTPFTCNLSTCHNMVTRDQFTQGLMRRTNWAVKHLTLSCRLPLVATFITFTLTLTRGENGNPTQQMHK
jgi:hypothetical protein